MKHQGKAILALVVTGLLVWDGALNEWKLLNQLVRQFRSQFG